MDYKKLVKIVDGVDDTTIVNSEDCGDKLYEVGLWCGSGYMLDLFRAYAFSEEEALRYVVAYCEEKGYDDLLPDEAAEEMLKEYDEDSPEFQEAFFYVDATIEGASRPHYVWDENLRIRQIKGADANSRTATKYNKVVNVDEAGTITVLQEVFSYGDGFKGAIGAKFEPVSEEEYEERTSLEALTEYLEDATELPEQYASYEDWAEDIIAAGEEGDLVFDQSYSSLWDMMREECGLSDEEAYIFNCVGGGRMFGADYQGNVNPELSEVIREAESK